MSQEPLELLEHYPDAVRQLYLELRELILKAAGEPEETLWAKQPSYSVGKNSVRLIPFRDHINIQAQAVLSHKPELVGFQITPKGMLQIYLDQEPPRELLLQIFRESLSG